jgi:hypothetical protein
MNRSFGLGEMGTTDRPIAALASQAATPISVPKVRQVAVMITT